MTTRIKLRRDTASNWMNVNPVLALAEPGVETDTNKMKIGDGTKTWTELQYVDGADVTRITKGFANTLRFPDAPSGEGSSIWWNSVAVDGDENSYFVGAFYDQDNTNQDLPIAAKYDVDGNLLWQTALTTVDGYAAEGQSVAIDPTNGELVVYATLWTSGLGQDPGSILYRLAPLTGELSGNPTRIRDDNPDALNNTIAIWPYDIAMDNDRAVVVGKKSGEYIQIEAPKQTGSSGTNLRIQRSILAQGSYPKAYANWTVNGTDINSNGTVTAVNNYQNIPSSATSQNGYDATFNFNFYITNGQTFQTVSLYYGGSAYQQGDTVTFTALSTGALQDAIITVDTVDGNGAILTFTVTNYTPNTDIIMLTVDPNGGSVDFSNSGTWNLLEYTNNSGYVYSEQGNGWKKYVGDTSNDGFATVAVDSNGNVYAAGWTNDIQYGWQRNMLVKFDNTGVMQYAKSFDMIGSEGNDGYTSVAVDSNDNVYVAGTNFDWDNTGNDFYTLTKVDSTGNKVWQKSLQQNGPFSMWNLCLAVDSDDNVYLAAETSSFISQNDDYYFAKFNSAGNVQWERSIQNWADVESNWNNGYHALTVRGNKFYYAGSSMTYSLDYNYGGFAFSAPTDGSGLGTFDNGTYSYIEISYGDWVDTPNQQTFVLNVEYGDTNLTTDSPSTGTSATNMTSYIAPLYTGQGGEVVL